MADADDALPLPTPAPAGRGETDVAPQLGMPEGSVDRPSHPAGAVPTADTCGGRAEGGRSPSRGASGAPSTRA
eukprot:10058604-Alexandrium_andersonii.AAC.1